MYSTKTTIALRAKIKALKKKQKEEKLKKNKKKKKKQIRPAKKKIFFKNKRLLIRLTAMQNNLFVLIELENEKHRQIIFSTSAGRLGFSNSRKRLFTTSWILGKQAGRTLRRLKNFKFFKTCLIIKNARLKNFRIRGFLRGLKNYAIVLNGYKIQTKFPYNGCKKRILGRTGRKRIFFFQ